MIKSVCAVLFILISGFIVSCTNVPGEIPVSQDPTTSSHFVSVSIPDAKDISSAVEDLKQYSDTANIAWNELRVADEAKLNHISQLVSGFQGKGSAFTKELDALKQLLKEVKGTPLTLTSQFNNGSLHHYDLLSDSLTMKTFRMYSHLKSAGKIKPSMVRLAESIQKDELEVKFRRELYNDAANRYNDFFWAKRTFVLQARGELPARPIRACFRNKV